MAATEPAEALSADRSPELSDEELGRQIRLLREQHVAMERRRTEIFEQQRALNAEAEQLDMLGQTIRMSIRQLTMGEPQ